jgi:hypothetical protein
MKIKRGKESNRMEHKLMREYFMKSQRVNEVYPRDIEDSSRLN